MDRRGDIAWGMIFAVAIGLAAMFILFNYFVKPSGQSGASLASCEANGGVCKSSCDESETRVWQAVSCKTKDIASVCCAKKDGSKPVTQPTGTCKKKCDDATEVGDTPGAGNACTSPKVFCLGGTGSSPATPAAPSIITPPTMKMIYTDTGQEVARGSKLLAVSGRPSVPLTLTAGVELNTQKECNSADPNIKTASVCNWGADAKMEITSRPGVAIEKQYTDTLAAVLKKEFDKITLNDNKIARRFAVINMRSPAEYLADSDKVELTKYVGQTLHLIIKVSPVGATTQVPEAPQLLASRQDLVTEFHLYFDVKAAVTASSISQTWDRSKSVQVSCDKKIMSCTKVVYEVKQALRTADPPKCEYTGEIVVPGNIKEPLNTVGQTKYVLYDPGTKQVVSATTYPNEGECRKALGLISDSDYMTVIGNLLAASQQSTVTPVLYGALQTAEERTSKVDCYPQPEVVVGGDAFIGQLYQADTFNQATQQGTITIKQVFGAAGTSGAPASNAPKVWQYLCVYGYNSDPSDNKYYSAGPAQRLMIDTIPPKVEIQFNPYTLKLSFICTDDDSGCKDQMGVAYIKDPLNFLPALISGPQAASKLCPAKTSGAYSLESRKNPYYTANELRVMCLMGEDNAGNKALTKTLVFNGYDILAKAILAAQQKK